MSWADKLRAVNEIDLADLDFENVGLWPLPVKLFAGALIFALVIIVGYYYHIEGLQLRADSVAVEEVDLKREVER